METSRILILGATGQVGKALFDRFQKEASFILTGTSRKHVLGSKTKKFDPFLDQWETLGKQDVVINCIGQINERHNTSFRKIHVGITEKILENRSSIGSPKIIQISALNAHPTHDVDFLRTKGIADDILLSEPNAYVVRPSIICTPGTMLVRKFKALKKIARLLNFNLIVPAGFLNTKIQPIMIEDVVETIIRLSTSTPAQKIIEAVGPDEISFLELTRIIKYKNGTMLRIKELKEGIFKALVKNFISPVLPGLITIDQYKLLFTDNVSDKQDVRNLLGRNPMSTLSFWERELN